MAQLHLLWLKLKTYSQTAGGWIAKNATIGKITAIHGNSLQVARPDGATVTVNLTDRTEYRKDRQPAQLSDFKVGDFVMARGDENADHSVTAQSLNGRSSNGGGPGGGAAFGEMGKDFVAGVVKSVDAPKLTVMRADNVTQTLELNEDTSLRRGRESITMTDIQPGDHVVCSFLPVCGKCVVKMEAMGRPMEAVDARDVVVVV